MKHFFPLLGVLVGLTASLSAQTDAASSPKTMHRRGLRMHELTVRSPQQPARVYYITNNTITGSHIPVIFRQYNGRTEPISSGFRHDDVFTAGDIGITGALDVGTALNKLEPAITSGGGRH